MGMSLATPSPTQPPGEAPSPLTSLPRPPSASHNSFYFVLAGPSQPQRPSSLRETGTLHVHLDSACGLKPINFGDAEPEARGFRGRSARSNAHTSPNVAQLPTML
jgi:hypothetical protein